MKETGIKIYEYSLGKSIAMVSACELDDGGNNRYIQRVTQSYGKCPEVNEITEIRSEISTSDSTTTSATNDNYLYVGDKSEAVIIPYSVGVSAFSNSDEATYVIIGTDKNKNQFVILDTITKSLKELLKIGSESLLEGFITKTYGVYYLTVNVISNALSSDKKLKIKGYVV